MDMNLMIRPSKSFLYDVLERKLARLSGEVGLDAASANFKNRRMFKTKYYYGLDYDLTALRQGLAKYPESNTFGIHADLARLEQLPDNSADVIVSTNTLYQLPLADRQLALHHLCRICSSAGMFLCELVLDDDSDESAAILRSYFADVKIIYYRNPVSRFYESIFERNGNLGSHPIAGLRPFRLLAWFLSRFEYLTSSYRSLNRRALIICQNKVQKSASRKFDLTHLPLKEGRIYAIIN